MSNLFPRWMNALPTVGAIGGGCATVAAVVGTWYYATPDFWEVGYMPIQPGAGFNHQLHVAQLGMDCRYCHTNVEESNHANVPNVSTCIGCHAEGKLQGSETHDVVWLREAYEADASIEWRRVHLVPDYAHFPHAIHVNAGVSCYSCHGQIAGMPVVYQAESLSMGWCLECHRDSSVDDEGNYVPGSGSNLVPPEKVTDLVWIEQEWMSTPVGQRNYNGITPEDLVESLKRNPPQHCAACHY